MHSVSNADAVRHGITDADAVGLGERHVERDTNADAERHGDGVSDCYALFRCKLLQHGQRQRHSFSVRHSHRHAFAYWPGDAVPNLQRFANADTVIKPITDTNAVGQPDANDERDLVHFVIGLSYF